MHCHHGAEEALRSPPPTCALVDRGHCCVTPGMQPSSTPLPALTRKHGLSAMAIHVQGLRRALKAAIRDSKRQCFLKLCNSAGQDPWGRAYKLVSNKLCAKSQAPPSDPDTTRSIVEELFPYRADHIGDVRCLPLQPPNQAHIEEVSLGEVARAARSISPRKAPGPDSYR
ncbi:GL18358 [Drosophila persimilis]|uniref:GL18358 n=1 Tax=Drosophila persimilis TaxID=7234 RepID=B4HCP7_DROPE|nr:GL18358 [Drosophila persimilis]